MRATGALVGVGVVGAVTIIATVSRPFDLDEGRVADRPEILVFVLCLTAIVGWWAARVAAGGGFLRAGAVGVGAGVAWVLLAVAVAVAGAFVDALARNAASAFDIGPTLIWGLYGLFYVTAIASVFTGPLGLLRGLLTRLVVGPRLAPGQPDTRPTRHPGRRSIAALTILAVTSGLTQAAISSPPEGARCLDVGQQPLDGAFSPDGEWLAVVASNDLNEGGLVQLIRWPSAETVATWHTWVDHDVVVDPDGRAYWSAYELEEPWRGGILTAAAGSEPEWLTTNEESGLWSLTWTNGALRGMTSNSHRVASLSLDAGADPSLAYGPATDPVGTFWASSDGDTTATSAEWFATHVAVTRPDGSVTQVPVDGDPRSIALTPDGESLVAATWSDGTWLVDIESGSSERLLRGSQPWIAVSGDGDVAWTNEEQVGPGQVCVAPLLADRLAPTSQATP